jgi:hypothetical protein
MKRYRLTYSNCIHIVEARDIADAIAKDLSHLPPYAKLERISILGTVRINVKEADKRYCYQ